MSDYRLYTPDECTGHKGYPPVWHERLKHEVREQAGNRCVRCGHPYAKGMGEWSPCDEQCLHGCDNTRWRNRKGKWVTAPLNLDEEVERQARWRILTVHHLDGVKGNCRWWNLVSLCQRCHLTIQLKVHMDRRWPHEHSDWFKPYVAGYYAHIYLGEDLTREETEARLDELLALEVRQMELSP